MNMKYVIVLVITSAAIAEGRVYHVGDDLGWTIPPSLDYYAQWAAKYDIVVHDRLEFDYEEGASDVALLRNKDDFDTCNTTNPSFVDPNLFEFSSYVNGTYYFTSTFADHCAKGQKVAIYFSPSAAADQSQASQPLKLVSEKMGTSRKVSVTMA